VHAGQSASSSVIADPQCEHRNFGAGSATNTAMARPAGEMVGLSFIP
jgi:hypothetical protein